MSESHLRIAVTGLAATYPFGGVFWDYVQYVLGFHRLGHDVLYVEDTGKWCYSPTEQTFVESGRDNAALLDRHLRRVEPALADKWFYRDARGAMFGRSWAQVESFCRTADLFVHISASCCMREPYMAADTVVFIDSDPMYTQASVPDFQAGVADADAAERIDMLRRHDVFFTFGANVGAANCAVPAELFDWRPTRQPIVRECFEPFAVPTHDRRRALTTVASWKPHENGPRVNGVQYSDKGTEFERFIDLPRHSPLPIELALSGEYPAQRLRDYGWSLIDAYSVSHDPWVYRDYLANATGEWSVAKQAYVASHSGWFSCRSACYLALGVPTIVQDTGFTDDIPAGAGVLAFSTLDEARDAIDRLVAAPEHHSEAARQIVAEYFDADKVLTRFIEECARHAGRP